MKKEFIEYDGMLTEFKHCETFVDYNVVFNNISKEVDEFLVKLTDYYFDYLSIEMETSANISIPIHNAKNIDGLPTRIHLYMVKNHKLCLNISSETVKLGFFVSLPKRECMSSDHNEIMQNIYIHNCNIEDPEKFKNYIYNILFYVHVVVSKFVFNPMLKYLNHRTDVPSLIDLSSAHINLFGENTDCSVCMEQTTTKTVCNHELCRKCYCSLEIKICPICRRSLIDDEDEDYYISTNYIDAYMT
jgi:hypothetical protein